MPRAACHRQEFLPGHGVRGQFFLHPNLALLALPALTWPHGPKDWGLGALALDLAPAFGNQHLPSRTAALPDGTLPSTITHPKAWNRKPASCSSVRTGPSLPGTTATTSPRPGACLAHCSLREQAQAMIRAAPLAPRLLASVSHLIFANALPLNSCL